MLGKLNHYLARVSIFLVAAALIAGTVGCDGDGSQNLEIRTWYDLDAIRDNLSGNYTLMNDLDSTTAGYDELASPTANGGKGWQPIGNFTGSGLDFTTAGYTELASPTANDGESWQPIGTQGDLFTGTFDGQGHEIRDLFINRPDEMYVGVGLFGVVGEGGIVQNIGVVNANVTAGLVGGLVGTSVGTVSNSYSTGSVAGEYGVGGLVGANAGNVSYCYSTGSVTGTGAVGGLVGFNDYGTVSNSYSTGSVTGENYAVGGLVGQNAYGGTVSNSYSTGSVTGGERVGGLVGVNGVFVYGFDQSIVSNSYYNYDEVLINGENIITIGALLDEDFDEWLANDKFLDINDRLSQESGYYVVNNIADFKELLAFGQDNSLKFRLKNDLDLATEPNFYIPYFAGEFDGNGHKISNLSFDFDFISDVGLFGCLASGGKVTDLGVENVNITGSSLVGGLVGLNWEGTVSDCYATGSVIGTSVVGGLVGRNQNGTVSDSYSAGSMSGNASAGGLVGYSNGTVSNSYSTGSVTGYERVGGLVGYNGYSSSSVSNSYSTGSVTGNEDVGGLVGRNSEGTVSNSYSSGSVTGDVKVGGLVGYNDYSSSSVSNSYSTGSVTGDEYVGGLVGRNNYEGTVSDSFWDTETSGQATSDGGTGKTTAEMQDIATFSGAGWNIIAVANPGTRNPSYIWNIVDDETYPFLSWQFV
jgi:hypothetical protein